MLTAGGSTQGRKQRLKVNGETDEVWETLCSGFGEMCLKGSCLEQGWCKKHWTASGSGSLLRLYPSPWWRSSGKGCGTPGDSTAPVGQGQRAEVQGLCARSGPSLTSAPHGSADPGASGLYISAKHVLEVLGETKRDAVKSSSAHVLSQIRLRKLTKTCLAPFIGLSLVWLNSETGTPEKPARKSRLLTPVTLRVCRPLQLTFRKKQ